MKDSPIPTFKLRIELKFRFVRWELIDREDWVLLAEPNWWKKFPVREVKNGRGGRKEFRLVDFSR